MKKILNLVLAYVLIFNSVFASTITNNLNVGGDSNVTGSSFISKILSIAGSFVTPDSKVEGSFENGTSQWVVSAGSSLTATSTDYADGSKSGSLSLLAGGTADLCADMSKLSGRDIESSAEFKNSSTGLQICTLKNSVEATCNTITPDSYWKNWSSISKAIGSGQHCLRIKNPTAGTLTALVDSAKIGKAEQVQFQSEIKNYITIRNFASKDASHRILFAYIDTVRSYYNDVISYDTSSGFSKIKFLVDSTFEASAKVTGASSSTFYIVHMDSSGNILSDNSQGNPYGQATSAVTGFAKAGDIIYSSFNSSLTSDTYGHLSVKATQVKNNTLKTWEPSDRIGETIYLPQNVAPKGFISAMGSVLGKNTGTYQGDTYYNLYKVLWNVALNTAGQPYYISAAKGTDALTDWNAGKTITIDESGLFTRAYKSGVSGNIGEKQDDAFQGHGHVLYYLNGTAAGGGNSVVAIRPPPTTENTVAGNNIVKNVEPNGTNGTPRTASETRPVNVAKYVFIRYATSEPVVLAVPTSKDNNKTYDTNQVSITGTNWTTSYAKFYPYRTIDKATGLPKWRLSFNIVGTTSTGYTGDSIYISGITWARAGVPLSMSKGVYNLYANAETYDVNGVNMYSSSTNTAWNVSGDVELASKPSWADEWVEPSAYIGEVAKNQVAYIRTQGGTVEASNIAATTAFKTRDLLSVEGDSSIAPIGSNRVTLQAGEYDIEVPVGAYNTGANWTNFRLYNYSLSTPSVTRTTVAFSNTAAVSYTIVRFRLSVQSPTVYEFQTSCDGTPAGGQEYFGTIKITKLNGN